MNHVSQFGIQARLEVSIRPDECMNSRMRSQGHFIDFLAHVLLVIIDCLKGSFALKVVNDGEKIKSSFILKKMNTIIQDTQNYLHFRLNVKFIDYWIHKKYHVWLRAQISLLLIVTGFAPQYGIQYISKWVKEKSKREGLFIDPFLRIPLLLEEYSFFHESNIHDHVLHPEVNNGISKHDSMMEKKIQSVMNNVPLSNEGRICMKQFMSEDYASWSQKFKNRGEMILSYFRRLNPTDKCKVANFQSCLLPFLLDGSKGSTERNDDEIYAKKLFQETNGFNDDDDDHVILHEDEREKPSYINESLFANNTKNYDPTDSVIQCMSQFQELSNEPTNPVFIKRLFTHVMNCHENELLMKGKKMVKFDNNSEEMKAIKKIANNGAVTHAELYNFCDKLSVSIVSNERSKKNAILSICWKYMYPCAECNFGDLVMKDEDMEKLNESINQSMQCEMNSQFFGRKEKNKIMNDFDDIYFFNVELDTCPNLRCHPNGSKRDPKSGTETKDSGYNCIMQCLSLTTHYQTQPLTCMNAREFRHDLFDFCQQENFWSKVKEQNVNIPYNLPVEKESLNKNMESLILNEDMNHQVTLPIVCSKFKINIILWITKKNQPPQTEMYQYITTGEVIHRTISHEFYCYIKNEINILYLQLSLDQMKYCWYPPSPNYKT